MGDCLIKMSKQKCRKVKRSYTKSGGTEASIELFPPHAYKMFDLCQPIKSIGHIVITMWQSQVTCRYCISGWRIYSDAHLENYITHWLSHLSVQRRELNWFDLSSSSGGLLPQTRRYQRPKREAFRFTWMTESSAASAQGCAET